MSELLFTQRDFRNALSSFATGVTIVTAVNGTGEPVGMTVTSFNSVSMDPPLILWSVTKTAYSAPVFQTADHFAINVLSSDQIDLSNRFARPKSDKFKGIKVRENRFGVPLIDDALTCFECKTWAVYEGGDHWIIIGEVQNLTHNQGIDLVFSQGAYATAMSVRAKPE